VYIAQIKNPKSGNFTWQMCQIATSPITLAAIFLRFGVPMGDFNWSCYGIEISFGSSEDYVVS
jgi:hypothetical protein